MIDITVTNLVKAFEVNKNILDGLSFQVQRGERVGILGRNGAGKQAANSIIKGQIPTITRNIVHLLNAQEGMLWA